MSWVQLVPDGSFGAWLAARIAVVIVSVVLVGGGVAFAHEDDGDTEPSKAWESRVLTDKVGVRLGATFGTFETDVSVGSGLGARIRLEEVLGYDEEVDAASVSGFVRFGAKRKHALRFGYGRFDRNTSGVITGTIPIFDAEYFGAFRSEFNNTLLSLVYQHSLVNTGRVETGFTAGLAIYEFDLFLDARAQIAGVPLGVTRPMRKISAAPVPNVGVFTTYAIRPKLIFEFQGAFLDLDTGKFSGRLLATGADLTWYFSRYVGIGVGFKSTEINYEKDSKGSQLTVDYRQNQYVSFLTYVF